MQGEQIVVAADDGIGAGSQGRRQELGVTRVAAWRVEGGGISVGHGDEKTISPELCDCLAPRGTVEVSVEFGPFENLVQLS